MAPSTSDILPSPPFVKAVLYDAFGRAPELVEVPDPAPEPDGVVVRVGATGVCRSDWHAWMGHDPDVSLPHVPGHELAGTVEAVGPEVRRWRAGDRVTVPFVLACGGCAECRAGHQQVCERQAQPGFTRRGSFAELVSLPRADANLVALHEAMDFATAAGLGCRFATAFRAVVDRARVGAGDWLAVHGCGGVGLSAVMIGHAVGANVIAVDVSGAALARARELGAAVAIDASAPGDVVAAVIEASGGGAHASLDALGHPVTCAASVACLRRRGRHVQVGLLLGEHATPPVPMDRVVALELELLGSHGMAAHRYGAMLAMAGAGTLDPAALVGERIALAEAPRALARMDRFESVGATVVTRF